MGALAAALAYPTVVLTVGLGVCVVYWIFVFLGALDVNLLGAGEGAHDGALEGAAKGVAHAHTHPHSHDLDGTGILATIFSRKAPVTVTLSVHLALAWLVCVLASPLLGGLGGAGTAARLGQTALLVVALAATLPIASVVVAPLGPLFAPRKARSHRELVGRVCTVTTGTVDTRFGQAHLKDGGAGLLLHVRNDGGTLKRGDEALIVAWDEARESFLVEPMTSVLGGGAESRPRSAVAEESLGDEDAAQESAPRGRRET